VGVEAVSGEVAAGDIPTQLSQPREREPLADADLERTSWLLADYPIDTFLLNDATNYVRRPDTGRACHFARVHLELALADQSIASLVAFRRGCADAGIGRNLITYVQRAQR
jgi:hypothetical protein